MSSCSAVVGTWDAVKRLNLAPTLKDGGPWWNDTETTSIAQEMGHNLTNNLFSTIMDLSSNKTNTSEISTLS